MSMAFVCFWCLAYLGTNDVRNANAIHAKDLTNMICPVRGKPVVCRIEEEKKP